MDITSYSNGVAGPTQTFGDNRLTQFNNGQRGQTYDVPSSGGSRFSRFFGNMMGINQSNQPRSGLANFTPGGKYSLPNVASNVFHSIFNRNRAPTKDQQFNNQPTSWATNWSGVDNSPSQFTDAYAMGPPVAAQNTNTAFEGSNATASGSHNGGSGSSNSSHGGNMSAFARSASSGGIASAMASRMGSMAMGNMHVRHVPGKNQLLSSQN